MTRPVDFPTDAMRSPRWRAVVVAAALLCPLFPVGASEASGAALGVEGTFLVEAYRDVSIPLRDMVAEAAPTEVQGVAPPLDGAEGEILGHTGLAIVENFDGIATPAGSMSTWASDADGDVGHNFFMEATNFSAAIYDKTGSLVMGPFPTSMFWSGFSAPCGGTWSDVIVLYDQEVDRWFVTRFARQNADSPLNWYQCFAISQTSDPTGMYYRYAFLMDPEEFNDYPKFGIWPDAYYMTADRDKIFPGTGNFVAAFERSEMLTGGAAQAIVMKLDNNGNRAGMLPADWDGDTPPPAGSPGYFIKTLDTDTGWPADAIEVWELDVDWGAGTGVLSLHATLAPDAFDSAVCDLDQNCIEQPDTANGLDPLAGGRPMFRLAYRNFGTHEAMVFNHTVEDAEDQAAVRWYELRKSGAGSWSIHQQQTFAPDSNNYWIGSAAMDWAGNTALVYNVSGADVYPSIRVAARLPGDPLDTIEEEATIMAGSGSQTGFVFWADYSSLTLDPADDCTFWSTATYQPTTTSLQGWATRISAFRFPDCVTDLALSKAASPGGSVLAGTDVTWTIEVTNEGPSGAGSLTLTDDVPAGTSFVSLSAPDWSCTTPPVGGTGAIECLRDKLANGESSAADVVATVNCSTPDGTVIDNTASVGAATPPDVDLGNNSASDSFTVDNPVPVVTASVVQSMLPQNNHNLVDVGLSASATDGDCPDPALMVRVYSDEDDQEPPGAGEIFSPDATGIAPETLRLRQERLGPGDGRVYLIVVSATDEAGGVGFATLPVTVPHSSSEEAIDSVTAQAAAARAFADANGGAAPPGYFEIGDGPVIGPKQ